MINLRVIPIVFCVGVLIAFNGIAGEFQRSLDDYDARREFDLASSAIARIHSVLESEMKRVMFRQRGPQSPDVQKYIYTNHSPPNQNQRSSCAPSFASHRTGTTGSGCRHWSCEIVSRAGM